MSQLGIKQVNQEKLAKELKFNSTKELFAALGSREPRILQILHVLHRYSEHNNPTSVYLPTHQPSLHAMEERATYYSNTHQTVSFKIVAQTTLDILDSILNIIKKQNVTLRALSTRYHPAEQCSHIKLCIALPIKQSFEHLLNQIQLLKPVTTVEKIESYIE